MEVQEVKEQLKSIFRQVINNDKWITKYDKEGEPYHVNIDDTDDKEDKSKSVLKGMKEERKKIADEKIARLKEIKSKLKNLEDVKDTQSLYDETQKISTWLMGATGVLSEDEVDKNLTLAEDIKDKIVDYQTDKGNKSNQPDKKEDKKEIIAKAEKSLSSNKFIPNVQKSILKKDLKGEEYEHFADKIEEIQEQIKNAPKMYETDGKKDKKPILHYFGGSYDNYVYEIDKATGEMFGAVNMGYGYELGYSSMAEINSVPSIELDLYFDGKVPKELSKKVNNNKEQDMSILEDLKKLITKVENGKESDMEKIENEKVDKRDIIRQIMAIAGKEEASEDVKTIAKLAEKLAYDKSEAGTADNKCKNEEPEKDEEEVKEVKEEIKEDVDNKCKNSKEDYFSKLNEIYNAASKVQEKVEYTSRADREKAAEEYFAR